MKKIIFLSFLLVMMLSCSKSKSNNKTILTAIAPQKYILQQITDTSYSISNFLNEGDNPTIFNISPKMIKIIKNSSIYISVHLPFEKILLPKIKQINPKIRIIDPLLADSTLKNKIEKNENFNPHTWLSIKLLIPQIKLINDSLYNIYKDSSIITKSKKLINDFKKIDNDISSYLSFYKDKKFIIYHPSLYYYAKNYNLVEIPIEKEGKNPGPKDLINIVNEIKNNNIPGIIFQKEFDTTNVELIKSKTKIKTYLISPMEYDLKNNLINITRKLLFIFKDEK